MCRSSQDYGHSALMFRVPIDPYNPSFDLTEKISLGRWVLSSKTERAEWARRRNAAAQGAAHNQRQKVAQWQPSFAPPPRQPQAPRVRAPRQSPFWRVMGAIETFVLSAQLMFALLGTLLLLGLFGLCAWAAFFR